jgi:hypothetical protein
MKFSELSIGAQFKLLPPSDVSPDQQRFLANQKRYLTTFVKTGLDVYGIEGKGSLFTINGDPEVTQDADPH